MKRGTQVYDDDDRYDWYARAALVERATLVKYEGRIDRD